MAKKATSLIIVESPAKAKKITSYVPGETLVMASVGHIRDLPKYVLGVNVAQEFAPNYEIPKDKKKPCWTIKRDGELKGKADRPRFM